MGFASKLIATGALLLCANSAFAIYKCTDAGGKTSFQETPCAGSSQGGAIQVKPASGQADPAKIKTAEEQLAKIKGDNAVEDAVRKRLPLQGMTAADLKRAMGQPNSYNPSVYQGGKQQNQHVYYRADGTWYVYTDETGRVTDIQHQQTAASPQAPQRKACPTTDQIRDAETEASSIALPYAIRVEKMKTVEEMKRCR